MANTSRVQPDIYEKNIGNQVVIFMASCNTNFCDDKCDYHTVVNIEIFLTLFRSVQTSCVGWLRVKIELKKDQY